MILDKLKQIFGISASPSAAETDAEATHRSNQLPTAPQVYRGRENVSTPDFAANAPSAQLPTICKNNLVCNFICRITRHRIYGESRDEKNTAQTFEGITANCDAIKRFGQQVASEDGYRGAYRYADLNHIFDCCCGDPSNCRFYNHAITEGDKVKKGQSAT